MLIMGKIAPCLCRFHKVWEFRGAVPEALTELKTNHIFQTYRASKSYSTKQAAIEDANNNGLFEFQVFE